MIATNVKIVLVRVAAVEGASFEVVAGWECTRGIGIGGADGESEEGRD